MNTTRKARPKSSRFQKGVAMVEYAMLLSSVAITAVVAINKLGDNNTAAAYQNTADSLASTSGTTSSGTSGTTSSGTSETTSSGTSETTSSGTSGTTSSGTSSTPTVPSTLNL